MGLDLLAAAFFSTMHFPVWDLKIFRRKLFRSGVATANLVIRCDKEKCRDSFCLGPASNSFKHAIQCMLPFFLFVHANDKSSDNFTIETIFTSSNMQMVWVTSFYDWWRIELDARQEKCTTKNCRRRKRIWCDMYGRWHTWHRIL